MTKKNKTKPNICILCFPNDNKNFGANLVCFSMQKIIEKMGYNASLLNFYKKTTQEEKKQGASFIAFREKYISLTNIVKTSLDFFLLNFKYNIFITGSDQVFNTNITKTYKKRYFLDFAHQKNGKIAFSASFGLEQFIGNKKLIKEIKKLLNRFNYISVRETSAINIMEYTFKNNFNAQITLDPSLLLDEKDYTNIINNDEKIITPTNKYIAAYIISNEYGIKNKETENLQSKIENKFNLKTINIIKNEKGNYNSISQWLNYIKNAEFVITDSFHGVCFSLIFKKNFAYLSQLGPTRVLNLLKLLNLEKLCYKSINDICLKTINYDTVEKKLSKLKKQSIEFLKTAIENC